jgi:hypothetical protein
MSNKRNKLSDSTCLRGLQKLVGITLLYKGCAMFVIILASNKNQYRRKFYTLSPDEAYKVFTFHHLIPKYLLEHTIHDKPVRSMY